MTTCPHCGKPIDPPKPERVEQVCWKAPNPHPPHPWQDPETVTAKTGLTYWCPGVKGTTMY